MRALIAVLIGFAGIGLLVFGLGQALVFYFARKVFERSLRSQAATHGAAVVEQAVERIRNPLVRRALHPTLRAAAGAAAVSLVRNALSSRVRFGAFVALGGAMLLLGALYVPFM